MIKNPTLGVWDPDEFLTELPPKRLGRAARPVEDAVISGVQEPPDAKAVRKKIEKLVATGETPTWERVIEVIVKDNNLASRVSTKLVRQILREFS